MKKKRKVYRDELGHPFKSLKRANRAYAIMKEALRRLQEKVYSER